MKKTTIIPILAILFLLPSILAYESNSSNYATDAVITSGSEQSINSTNYKINPIVNTLSGIINSSLYINKIGFFHGFMLINGEACSRNNECLGGYCCNSICRSTVCDEEETPTDGGDSGGGGGGGGGAATTQTVYNRTITSEEFEESLTVDKDKILVTLKLNKETKESITLTNDGEVALELYLNVTEIEERVTTETKKILLEPNEKRIVNINIEAGAKYGTFTGTLDIFSVNSNTKKSIPIILDVETENALFDVKLDMLAELKQVDKGEDVEAQITLINVLRTQTDALVSYYIKDLQGNVYHEESESFAVDNQKSYEKVFKTDNLEYGEYVLSVEVLYANSYAVSSDMFYVTSKEHFLSLSKLRKDRAIFILIVSMVLLYLLIMFFQWRKNR